MNLRLYRVLLWFGTAAAGIVGPTLLQEILAPFAAAFAFGYLLRAAVDRLELYRTQRGSTDLVA